MSVFAMRKTICRPAPRVDCAALVLALVGACGVAAAKGNEADKAPTDWRDQILYFAMVDRFADGNPGNNDQGAEVYDPADPAKYSGGDLAGLMQKLDYIEGLGVTGLWITPPVANQWWDSAVNFSGYHGYWASDFSAVDAHYGTLADYKSLSAGLHGRGMTLVQDIVVNHTGNFFAYGEDWDSADPTLGWQRVAGSRPMPAPTQWPFSQNNPNDPAQRTLGAYHWTPPVRDYTVELQERTFQMSSLDDMATENPVVRRALRQSFGHWIRDVGVDAFRVDTAFYVEPEFFPDFLHSNDAEAPGVMHVARAAGKPTFHLFGEGFGIDKPFEDTQMRKIDAYQRLEGGIPAMIQFPMYGTLGDVFARGHAPRELAWRIERTMAVHADPWRMPTFIDNHDVDRFLASASEAAMKQALLAMLTLPGIPVIYYGTEQGFREQRPSMFASGWGSGGRDHFNTQTPLYAAIKAMVGLRREHKALSRGTPKVLAANSATAGALAWTMSEGDGADTLLVAMNTADSATLMAGLALGEDQALEPLLALEGEAPALRTDAAGQVTLVLPARAGFVWRAVNADSAAGTRTAVALRLNPLPEAAITGDLALSGTAAKPDDGLRLVVDGQVERALDVAPDADGVWRITLPTDDFIDPRAEHSVVVFDPVTGRTSETRSFRVARAWKPLAEAADPEGDDHGPTGQYRYPTHPSYADHRSMDVLGGRLLGSGGALAIELDMAEVLATWNPANGFDHVAFTVFIALPNEDSGSSVMPLQDARLPEGLRWQRRLRVGGWSNALFTDDGAGPQREGRSMTPGARVQVDRSARTVRFELPSAALGHRSNLSGLRVVVSTWDYDGTYRNLTDEGDSFVMGGGIAGDPRWMDLLELRVP